MKLLLDTHVLLWWQAKSKKLSRSAARHIARADTLLVSAVSCWEVATLLAHGRITLDRPLHTWLEDLEADEKIVLVPLSPRAAIHALALDRAGFHPDPADRLIYATAADEMVPLLTADERMLGLELRGPLSVKTLW